MPTGTARLVWGFDDGSTLDTMDSLVGKVGFVICWENYMDAFPDDHPMDFDPIRGHRSRG